MEKAKARPITCQVLVDGFADELLQGRLVLPLLDPVVTTPLLQNSLKGQVDMLQKRTFQGITNWSGVL